MLVKTPESIVATLINEEEDDEENSLSLITEGEYDPEERFQPTPTPTVYETAAAFVSNSIDSYETHNRPDTRPNNAVVPNVRRSPYKAETAHSSASRHTIITALSWLARACYGRTSCMLRMP